MYGIKPSGAKLAREDFAFLFKAFESGQTPPHRLKKDQEHVPTIHQYLDWTVTGTPSAVRANSFFQDTRLMYRSSAKLSYTVNFRTGT